MYTHSAPDMLTSLVRLSAATVFEPAGDHPLSERDRSGQAPVSPCDEDGLQGLRHPAERQRSLSRSLADCITCVTTPTGRRPILKTMLTTACELNCFYCPFSSGRSRTQRLTFSPEKMARGFMTLYYSAFTPVVETPFENRAPAPLLRERRLYEASFLLRDYGWRVEELPFLPDGHLPLAVDPKLAWAEAHLRATPVELMQAQPSLLLRVPGIGPRAAQAIVEARRRGRLTALNDLRLLGIHAPERAAPYILLSGRLPLLQQRLF
jgi:predicted DNA-binding helix-hairpin-helix protein